MVLPTPFRSMRASTFAGRRLTLSPFCGRRTTFPWSYVLFNVVLFLCYTTLDWGRVSDRIRAEAAASRTAAGTVPTEVADAPEAAWEDGLMAEREAEMALLPGASDAERGKRDETEL